MIPGNSSLRTFLGDFWNKIWKDQQGLSAFINAYSECVKQLEDKKDIIPRVFNRHTVPSREITRWKRLTFRHSDIKDHPLTIGSFILGNGHYLGEEDQTTGQILELSETDPIFILSPNIGQADSSRLLFVDFYYENDKIVFKDKITDMPLRSFSGTDEDGNPFVEYSIWAGYINSPVTYLQEFFTNFFGILQEENDNFPEVFNIYVDILIEGLTAYNLSRFLNKAAGRDVPSEDGYIEEVWSENGYTFVKTTKELLKAYGEGAAKVKTGQSISKGDIIFEGVYYKSGNYDISESELPSFTLTEENSPVGKAVTFLNEEKTLTFDVDGKVILPVSGPGAEEYNAQVNERASESGVDLFAKFTAGKTYPYTINTFKEIVLPGLGHNMLFIFVDNDKVDDSLLHTLNWLTALKPAYALIRFNSVIQGSEDLEGTVTDNCEHTAHIVTGGEEHKILSEGRLITGALLY